MKLKTSELTGVALDWAVAKAEGAGAALVSTRSRGDVLLLGDPTEHCDAGEHYAPSTNWAQGGPIIAWEGIELLHHRRGVLSLGWNAKNDSWGAESSGPTPLIAAMRCYVAYRLGAEVDVPDSIALDSMIYETGDAE